MLLLYGVLIKCQKPFFDNINLTVIKGNKTLSDVMCDSVLHHLDATDIIAEEERIPKLLLGTFANLLQLKTIKLQNDRIERIEKGTFINLPKLKVINLNFNKIELLTEGIFNFLPVVQIHMRGNRIRYVEPETFQNLQYLQDLDMMMNNIEKLPANMFENTTNLRKLNLSYNKIKTLPQLIFHMGFLNNPVGIDSYIDLGHNQINSLSPGLFKGVYYVKTINLNNNLIDTIPDNIFSDIRDGECADFSGNYLKNINQSTLDSLMKSFKIVDMHYNNFDDSMILILNRTNVIY